MEETPKQAQNTHKYTIYQPPALKCQSVTPSQWCSSSPPKANVTINKNNQTLAPAQFVQKQKNTKSCAVWLGAEFPNYAISLSAAGWRIFRGV